MRKLRYVINVTLDGCVDHRAILPDAELHNFHAEAMAATGALLYGRVIYEMMEEAWRPVAKGARPDWVDAWMVPFAEVIDRALKYVVSDTLAAVDWNAVLLRGAGLEAAVRDLKAQPGGDIATGGVRLPLALAEMGLLDECVFVVMPRIAGHGPRLLDGLKSPLDLALRERREFSSGAVVLRYEVRR